MTRARTPEPTPAPQGRGQQLEGANPGRTVPGATLGPIDPSQQATRVRQVVTSALWAAWADALGFISELTDETELRRRLAGNPLTVPVSWRRRVGGRYGAEADLPAGCYSDDTQLRLAVGRAVNGRGFDVEAFARVELTVWPSYALGGGRASKAAATNLARPNTAWFANFYEGWSDAGGNGAAMRIQPHVWATAHPGELGLHLLDVLTDTVTTHGHPRALFGAVLHALALGHTLQTGQLPQPSQWPALLNTATKSLELLERSPQLAGLWRLAWEEATGTTLADAWQTTAAECTDLLATAQTCWQRLDAPASKQAHSAGDLDTGYRDMVERFGLTSAKIRGSGTHTAVAALALAAAAAAHETPPERCALTAAAALGTDTDTIATMAAALIGATTGVQLPPTQVLDQDYITAEAERLAAIACGHTTEAFSYPDLLHWAPPRTQLDACGTVADQVALAGLAWCQPAPGTAPVEARGNLWQWMTSDAGPTFLIKQRPSLRPLPEPNQPIRRHLRTPSRHAALSAHPPTDVSTSLEHPAQDWSRRQETLPLDEPQDGNRNGLSDEPAQGSAPDPLSHDRLDQQVRQPGTLQVPQSSPRDAKRPSSTSQPIARHLDESDQVTGDRNASGDRSPKVNVDQMLTWVAKRDFTDEAVGYALRRICQLGTLEHAIAFTDAVRATVRRDRHEWLPEER